MSTFVRCDACGGVVPGAVCPNCLTAVSRGGVGGFLKRLILGVGGASVASMTLMACYGMPPCDPEGTYRFTVYALDAKLDLSQGAELPDTLREIAAHTIARGRLTAATIE